MKSAGCRTIWFGVESGSPEILKRINKGVTSQQVVKAFKLCKEEGIRTACSFVLGIPGEIVNDMNASFRFAKKLDPDWCRFNIYTAAPGSQLYEDVMQKRLYDRVEGYLAYVKTAEFNYESVIRIQRQFHKTFNRSPKRIFKKIRREGFLNLLRYNLRFFPSRSVSVG